MKKLFLLSSLLTVVITSISFGMQLPNLGDSTDMITYLQIKTKYREIYQSIKEAKNEKDAEALLRKCYDNPADRSFFYDRRAINSIIDLLRTKLGLTFRINRFYPFNEIFNSKDYRDSALRDLIPSERVKRTDPLISPASDADKEQVRAIFNQHWKRTNLEENFNKTWQETKTLVIRNTQNKIVGIVSYAPEISHINPDNYDAYYFLTGIDYTSAVGIYNLAVDQNHQRQGYAKRLLMYITKIAQEAGFNRLVGNAAPTAVGLYKKLGATPASLQLLGISVWKYRRLLEKDITQ